MNAARPEPAVRSDVTLRCLEKNGVAEYAALDAYDERGNPVRFEVPVVYRRRCKNRACCPPRDGHIAVHYWTIFGEQNGKGVGEYVTKYVPLRSAGELPAWPKERAGHGTRDPR